MDRVDRRESAVCAGDEGQAVRGDGRGHGDVAAALEIPDLLAGCKVVAASVAKSVEGAETTAHAIPMVAFRETMDRLGSVVDFLKLDREGSEWKTLERCRERCRE